MKDFPPEGVPPSGHRCARGRASEGIPSTVTSQDDIHQPHTAMPPPELSREASQCSALTRFVTASAASVRVLRVHSGLSQPYHLRCRRPRTHHTHQRQPLLHVRIGHAYGSVFVSPRRHPPTPNALIAEQTGVFLIEGWKKRRPPPIASSRSQLRRSLFYAEHGSGGCCICLAGSSRQWPYYKATQATTLRPLTAPWKLQERICGASFHTRLLIGNCRNKMTGGKVMR